MKPDAWNNYDGSPEYIRDLCAKLKANGISQRKAAAMIGVSDRAIRAWCSGSRQYGYTDQFALECLVRSTAFTEYKNAPSTVIGVLDYNICA